MKNSLSFAVGKSGAFVDEEIKEASDSLKTDKDSENSVSSGTDPGKISPTRKSSQGSHNDPKIPFTFKGHLTKHDSGVSQTVEELADEVDRLPQSNGSFKLPPPNKNRRE